MINFNLDQPADAIWVPADQVTETGVNSLPNQRHFDSVRQAVCFAMGELSIADRANLWVATEEGNLTIEQIEQLHRAASEGLKIPTTPVTDYRWCRKGRSGG